MTKDSVLPPHHETTAPTSLPPVARRVPKITEVHGERLVDDYFWLRDKANPEVAEYLEAENAYAAAVMRGTEEFQGKLYRELLSHIKETDENVPYRIGEWWYYARTEEGKQYPIYCRKKQTLDAPEQLVLDVNALAAGQAFMAIGAMTINDDGNLLAYSTDNTGFRQYTLHVKDLRTGELLPERVEKTVSAAWAADDSLLYTIEDHAKRPYRVYRHMLGTPVANDELIYEEEDELFRVGVFRCRSRRFLFMASESHTATEVRFAEAANLAAGWRVIQPREAEHEYMVDHQGDHFLILTNAGARNFRLVKAPVEAPGRANWTEVVAHRPDVMLEDIDCFARHYVLTERDQGLLKLRITDSASGEHHYIQFPEPAYTAYPVNNFEFDTRLLRFSYTSLVTPNSVYDYDVDARQMELKKQTEVPGGFDRANYQSERIFATAADGTRVPISLVYRKGLKKDGSQPLYLYGYGSYGAPMNAGFNSNRLALLDRGITFAIAHIRGGGDLGKPWHDAGKMMRKKNTFTDFITCAEHLIAEGFTRPERLCAEGGSAGGLLMGAVVNMRPELFRVIVSKVPFVDVMNTMLDDSLPLTIGEYEEWGNPNEPEAYRYMKSYSPYDNLRPGEYPAMLVRTAFNDSQVMYWEPAKYVAKLRTLKKDGRPLILVTNMKAGHGGASGRYDYLREVAFDYAFVLRELGIRA